MLDVLTVCSGIEAPSVAWRGLPFYFTGYSEIDPFACRLLAERHANVTNYGDLLEHEQWELERPDVIVSGTPCQSFSVAGRRGGMDDERGRVALAFLALVARVRPRWILWENVPGVLHSNEGRDFGTMLGVLGKLGYGCAWRVFNARYFGVPQQRRRVYLVGYFDDERPAGAVLFERPSLSRHHKPRCKIRVSDSSPTLDLFRGDDRSGGIELDDRVGGYVPKLANTLTRRMDKGVNTRLDEGHTPIAFSCKDYGNDASEVSPALRAMNNNKGRSNGGGQVAIASPSRARRLTPLECERLQGFPDDYTRIPYNGRPASRCPDAPRYKALGNSMAVPVMRWIGERLLFVDSLKRGVNHETERGGG